MSDPVEWGKSIAALVREYVARAVDTLSGRLTAIEQRFAELPVPKDGKDADPVDMAAVDSLVADCVAKAVSQIPPAEPGKSVTIDEVLPLLKQLVAEIPPPEFEPPKDGKSVTLEDVAPMIEKAVSDASAVLPKLVADSVQKAVAEIPPAEPGKSVDIGEVAELVRRAVDALPPPEPGKSVSAEEVDAIVSARVAKVLESEQAKWALDFERRAQDVLARAIDRIPTPKDGVDGLGFDDMEVSSTEDGTVTLRFVRGEQVREHALSFPVFADRGVFKDGEQYKAGHGVTFGGSFWIAKKDDPEGKPGVGEGWRLAVKKGRDGKDGRDGIDKTAPVKL